ncbi:MAG TPA: GNAT family N-acetyltransferase [Longimicrobiales bacterium]|nr:GNAT family N-acetyltransferase [Longimicrobiales bacterium]
MTAPAPGATAVRVVEVDDERSPLADDSLALIARTFDPRDSHPPDELRAEIAEKRLGLIAPFDFHVLAASEGDVVIGVVIGAYLAGVNAGFVNYLAVAESHRGHGVGRLLRPALVQCFRDGARRAGNTDLNWVLGEVRSVNPWLQRLVASRGAVPFDLAYYHPGMRPGPHASPYILYRQPVGNHAIELPVALVRQLLYAIYRRAYRVRYPLRHEGFTAMLEQLAARDVVGPHPGFVYPDPEDDGPAG